MNSHEDSKDMHAQCTELIQKGLSTVPHFNCFVINSNKYSLEQIMGESSIHMNYVNYDTDIISQHHVRLDSWPIGLKYQESARFKTTMRHTEDYSMQVDNHEYKASRGP